MYHSVVVPLDGSTFGEHALPLALSVARRAGATLNVVQVHVPLVPINAANTAPGTDEVEMKVLNQERAYLDGIVKMITSVTGVQVTSTLLKGQMVAETLNGHVAATGGSLIIMATHGRGALSRSWLGSVADEVVKRATVPLLLARPHEKAPDFTAEPAFPHILIPLDGSVLAEQVLESAICLGSLMQADYTLIRIYGPLVDTGLDSLSYTMVGGFEPSQNQLRAEANDYLNRVAERMQQQGLNVQTDVCLAQHPASAILDKAHSLGMSLIALETHGRRGLPRLLLGSVADKVIRGASVPVLVHHSP